MIMVAMVTVALGYQVSTHFKVQLQAVAPSQQGSETQDHSPELDCNLVCVQLTNKLVHGGRVLCTVSDILCLP